MAGASGSNPSTNACSESRSADAGSAASAAFGNDLAAWTRFASIPAGSSEASAADRDPRAASSGPTSWSAARPPIASRTAWSAGSIEARSVSWATFAISVSSSPVTWAPTSSPSASRNPAPVWSSPWIERIGSPSRPIPSSAASIGANTASTGTAATTWSIAPPIASVSGVISSPGSSFRTSPSTEANASDSGARSAPGSRLPNRSFTDPSASSTGFSRSLGLNEATAPTTCWNGADSASPTSAEGENDAMACFAWAGPSLTASSSAFGPCCISWSNLSLMAPSIGSNVAGRTVKAAFSAPRAGSGIWEGSMLWSFCFIPSMSATTSSVTGLNDSEPIASTPSCSACLTVPIAAPTSGSAGSWASCSASPMAPAAPSIASRADPIAVFTGSNSPCTRSATCWGTDAMASWIACDTAVRSSWSIKGSSWPNSPETVPTTPEIAASTFATASVAVFPTVCRGSRIAPRSILSTSACSGSRTLWTAATMAATSPGTSGPVAAAPSPAAFGTASCGVEPVAPHPASPSTRSAPRSSAAGTPVTAATAAADAPPDTSLPTDARRSPTWAHRSVIWAPEPERSPAPTAVARAARSCVTVAPVEARSVAGIRPASDVTAAVADPTGAPITAVTKAPKPCSAEANCAPMPAASSDPHDSAVCSACRNRVSPGTCAPGKSSSGIASSRVAMAGRTVSSVRGPDTCASARTGARVSLPGSDLAPPVPAEAPFGVRPVERRPRVVRSAWGAAGVPPAGARCSMSAAMAWAAATASVTGAIRSVPTGPIRSVTALSTPAATCDASLGSTCRS